MNDRFRCFIAVGLSDALRDALRDFFRVPAARIGGVAWVRPDRLHLTLKFLGDVDRDRIPQMAAALDGALAGIASFTVRLRGAGAFPSAARPRVIWLGTVEGAAELTALAAAVERSLEPLGFPAEKRPFSAHLTIGRVKAPLRPPGALPEMIAGLRDRLWGDLVIPKAHLLRSELFPEGPRYSILHTVSLRASPPAERTNL